ncbi:AAA family ATPase [Actinoplanes sp. KI2]|uniref:AAA family ATPase n=1 Tax=Actinoplanes sp. KI2 TaxID=2983315 RepID=UPI0021D611A6|nr:AAA family ATPase [Actinoplanes sp. KI2]MCU7722491.1 AAA family ATPase [Actinoplanes sp. KI2]
MTTEETADGGGGPRMPGLAEPALVLLVGASGSGKSTLARRHYRASQIVSLDGLRAVVADDECDQDATRDAAGLLKAIIAARLARRLTTVVDATNGVPAERAELIALAAAHAMPVAAVVVDTDLDVCLARQHARPGPLPGRRWGRAVPDPVVRNQHARTRASVPALPGEGVTTVLHLTGSDPDGPEPAEAAGLGG